MKNLNIATYVKNNYETTCPQCGNESEFGFHLNPDQFGTPFVVSLNAGEAILNKYTVVRGGPTIACLKCGKELPRKGVTK